MSFGNWRLKERVGREPAETDTAMADQAAGRAGMDRSNGVGGEGVDEEREEEGTRTTTTTTVEEGEDIATVTITVTTKLGDDNNNNSNNSSNNNTQCQAGD